MAVLHDCTYGAKSSTLRVGMSAVGQPLPWTMLNKPRPLHLVSGKSSRIFAVQQLDLRLRSWKSEHRSPAPGHILSLLGSSEASPDKLSKGQAPPNIESPLGTQYFVRERHRRSCLGPRPCVRLLSDPRDSPNSLRAKSSNLVHAAATSRWDLATAD